jgi:transcriptional regulator GlxA family with amidase domain
LDYRPENEIHALKKRSPSPRTVDIIVYPGFKALEAIGPISVFEYANLQLQRRGQGIGYDVKVASIGTGAIQSDTLMSLQASKAINALALPDDAIIVGARHIEAALEGAMPIVDWVVAVCPRIGRLAALCSGAFFLARAGVLDGKSATTHWSVAQRLQQQFPAIAVNMDAIFIREDNIWTSAGVTAGIDLALAFVEEDFGRDLALEVAREMVVYLKRPGGQSQFSTHLMSQNTVKPNIREIQNWILENLDQPLTLAAIADKAMMSLRNFTRVFHQEAGMSTLEFIETGRFEYARQLLADVALPIKAVASRSGFRNTEHLRRVFQKRVGITAALYRERFATTGIERSD